jgi:hypothetical protein
MLHSISWTQFGVFIFTGILIYYGYVLVRYYGQELRDFAHGKKPAGAGKIPGTQGSLAAGVAPGKGAGMASAAVVPEAGLRQDVGQGLMFPDQGAPDGDRPELFKAMEKVIILLRDVVNEGKATGIRRDELEERIQAVLSGYRYLLKTPYEVSINNFLTRTCTTTFSLALTDQDVTRLWGA